LKLALPSRFRNHLGSLPSDANITWFSNAAQCLDAVTDADVLWVELGTPSRMSPTQLTTVVDAATRLRWIHTHGAGTEHHPLALYRERGLIFTNGSGISAIPISEHVIMVMLAAAKGLPVLIRAQEQSTWVSRRSTSQELFNTDALVLGYGALGRAIGDRLKPFGVRVTGVRRRPSGEPGVLGLDEWRSQLSGFDWVIVAVILTPDTRHLIGAAEFAAMRSSAWLVNISRGGVVDQEALLLSLQRGAIGGACLDVTDPEPLPRESALWRCSNVILTPHSSWSSPNFDSRSATLFLELLEQFRRGGSLQNTVDLEAGYRVT
jgi:phosphoglycerate dehydrogenase-like enzyme